MATHHKTHDAPEVSTSSGIPLRTVYETSTNADLPGEYPFTRGIHADMYRGRLWTIRQYAGFGDTEATNRRYRYLLDRGQTGISMAFDLPTQIGYDSDDPIAAGEVGKVGVPISCVDDLDDVLAGIPLDSVSISMTINSTAAILLAFLIAVARRRDIDPSTLRGTLQNDMLKEFITRRTYRFPIGPSLSLSGDVLEYCSKKLPRFYPISVSGYHMREAGSTAVQELGFTLANAISYLELAAARGLDVEAVAARMSFFWNAHNELLEEVAKFRAARRLWARIIRERFEIESPRCAQMRFHTQTAGSTLASVEPENNVVRVTLQALAAVLGGTQSLHTNSLDEALGLPSRQAARIALRTQQILAHESGIAAVADPLGGAPVIEELTDEIEGRAERIIAEIDALGGAVHAVSVGHQQQRIETEAYRQLRAFESGDSRVVGVNCFTDDPDELQDNIEGETPTTVTGQRIAADVEAKRKQALEHYRSQRAAQSLGAARRRLIAAARGGENLMDAILECAEEGATVGEMCSTLAEVWGEYRE